TEQRDLAESRLQDAKSLHRSQLRDTFHAVRDLEGALDEKLRIAANVAAYFEGLRERGQAENVDLEALADAYFELAEVRGGAAHGNLGQLNEALIDIGRAREVWQSLADNADDKLRARIKVAIMRRREALILQELERFPEAVASLEAGQRLLETVPPDHPNSLAAQRVRGLSLLDQGDIRWAIDDHSMARESWQRGMEILAQLAEAHSDNARVRRDYAHAYRRVGLSEADVDARRSLNTLRESRVVFQALHEDQPNNDPAHRDLAMAWYYEGWAAMLIPLRDESIAALESGWTIVIKRCVASPEDALARSDVTEYIGSMVEILRELNALKRAHQAARNGAIAIQPIVESHPDNLAIAEVHGHLVSITREPDISNAATE
ncbi:MAG: hypothetical protein MK100_00985, partial [Phycisphaerales bacterium]|nr:hypothetical protein [Phycisphaerales bacterium]